MTVAGTPADPRAIVRSLEGAGVDPQRDLGAGVAERLDLSAPRSLLAGPPHAITSEGPLDVITKVAGLESFGELRADARRAKFGDGTAFVVASKQSLELIKEAVSVQEDPLRGGVDSRDLAALRELPDPELPRAE